MNKDMLQLRDDIRSTLADIRNEMHTLRSEQVTIKQRVSDLRDDVIILQTSAQSQSTEYEILKKRIDELNSQPAMDMSELIVGNLEAKIDALEQQARQCNVEICNLPERRSENLITIMENISAKIKFSLNQRDIISIHRVPHARKDNNKPKNIVVKLSSRILRDNLLSAFRLAKGIKSDQIGISGAVQSIYINEHLTLKNKQLFRAVKEIANKNKYKFVWVKHATILVRETDASPAIAIRSTHDISKIKSSALSNSTNTKDKNKI
ncbi:hypothetical protein PYW08_008119 [Mythimna loreyi]|uniref:Uncharacterized protein n=1 Tax=Mythimna loreyi TaxID=667449 RepID=A0ACC2QAL9_9NEOP|nr:hypothetical protein PYW08_008119 [Mythimna loreyi]